MASIDGAGVWCCAQASSPCCLPLAAGRGLTWSLYWCVAAAWHPQNTAWLCPELHVLPAAQDFARGGQELQRNELNRGVNNKGNDSWALFY